MVSIRRKILYKGTVIKEQFLKLLQKHEDRITALEKSSGTSTEFKISDLTDADTVEAIITYADTTTETVTFVVEKSE